LIIKSIRVQNFRCIKDATLDCENLTVLVGPNGSGKSSFLRALEIFYNPSARYIEDDFYAGDISQNIEITVTFSDLTNEEKQLLKKYVEGKELTVKKVIVWPYSRSGQKYYGTSLQNPDFEAFRSASGYDLRKEYNKLLAIKEYSTLPSYANKDDAKQALSEWEQSNPSKCKRQQDIGQFFGFKEVGEAHLERYTKFLLVPAVRNASEDAIEGRGSVITEMMDLVVRSTLSQRKEIVEFQETIEKRYKEIFDPSKLTELKSLQKQLSETLRIYVPEASVELSWQEGVGIDFSMPEADIKLVEDGNPSPVGYTGHGLQRAFILTMLQHLALIEAPTEGSAESDEESTEESSFQMPSLIIGMEEPELYQHPNRQRHLARVLAKLTEESIPEVVKQMQVMYRTHSPLFVDLERFEKIRVLHKEQIEDAMPKQTQISSTTLKDVARVIEKADDKPKGTYTGETLRPRLRSLMTPWMNEGFFAELAVLVEGSEDRAAIIGTALAMGYDLESKGISVIPCMGKTCLDRPIAIFSNLGIRVYAIWDSDWGGHDAKPEENHRLLRLFSCPIEDWPEAVTDQFACFKRSLMYTLRQEIGEEIFNKSLTACCEHFCLGKKKHAIKNPIVIQSIIQEAKRQGKSSTTLEKIVSKIVS